MNGQAAHFTQAMIVSLGGTAEPVAKAIAEHHPKFVSFLASHDSVVILGKVMELLEQEGLSRPEHRVVLVEDVNNLVHCYEKALDCARYLEEREIVADEVVVDYTGGTKNMTAALALATVGKGYRFSYVGGAVRTKGGLGIVESGAEVVHTGVSPWQIFAVEEWQHLVLYVKQYQYEAALTLVRETRRRMPSGEQMRWQGLEDALEGLLYWDRFNHQEALPRFKQGIRELENWTQVKDDRAIAAFVQEGRECLTFLQEMASETRGFKQMGRLFLADLVANAERRAAQGRYDDAMARLYRALEMQGQIALTKRLGVSTSDVPEDKIPEELRQEYCVRYRDQDTGKIQLPLAATFRLLKVLEDPAGQQFFARQQDLHKLLSARNSSILAHGLQPVSGTAYASLRDLLRQAFDIQEIVIFPRLRSPY